MKGIGGWRAPSGRLWIGRVLVGLAAIALVAPGWRAGRAVARWDGSAAGAMNRESALQGRPEVVTSAAPEALSNQVFLPALFGGFSYARLTVSKVADPASVPPTPGQVVTYTVTIANEGDTMGQLLTVYDLLPSGFAFLGMAADSDIGDDPVPMGNTIVWSPDQAVAPGAVLHLSYLVSPSALEGQYTNSVGVTAAHAEVPAELATATVTVEPPVLLQEDFEGGIDAWTAFLNYKRLEPGQWYWGPGDGVGGSGALTHDCCVGVKIASDALMMYLGEGSEDWSDYRAETKLLVRGGVDNEGNWEADSGDPLGFWIRGHYQDSPNARQWVSGYYVVVVGTKTAHHVRLSQIQIPGDCQGPCFDPLNQYTFDNPFVLTRSVDLPGQLAHHQWLTLAVEVRGNRITVWLDGELVIDYVDDVLPFLTGTIGFKTHETKTASFDDVVVTRLP